MGLLDSPLSEKGLLLLQPFLLLVQRLRLHNHLLQLKRRIAVERGAAGDEGRRHEALGQPLEVDVCHYAGLLERADAGDAFVRPQGQKTLEKLGHLGRPSGRFLLAELKAGRL